MTASHGSTESAAQDQRLEAAARLAGKVAHDFNNLLTAISGYAQLLKAELPPDSPLRDDVEEITRAASRATTLTGQLLAFSRRQALHLEACDLNELLTEMGPQLRQLAGAEVAITMSLQPDLPTALADALQLRQVIVNLVVNAVEAMPQGGTVRLETARDAPQPGQSAAVIITIRDTGLGIEPAVMARMFEPFVTTKTADKSAGLGLAIAYGVITQSGGRLSLDSTRGHGTTVRVSLPTGKAPEPLTRGG